MNNYVLTAPRYAKMFERNPITEEFTNFLQSATVWGGFGQGEPIEESHAPAEKGFKLARNVFQCPDRLGMAELAATSPMKQKFCYWIKRPMGQVVLFGLGGIIVYLLVKGSGE